MKEVIQDSLFDLDPDWKNLWKDMPEYNNEDLSPYATVMVHFAKPEDMLEFGKVIGQNIGNIPGNRYTKSIWFPKAEIGSIANKRYIDEP